MTGQRRTSRSWPALTTVAIAAGMLFATAAQADAATKVTFRAPARVKVDSLVSFSGTVVAGPPLALVAVQRRDGARWVAVATGHSAGGRFALTWAAPLRAGNVSLRAAVYRDGRVIATSAARRVSVLLLGHKGPFYKPSPRTVVLAPSTVISAPKPPGPVLLRNQGQIGDLRYSGGNNVRVGQIIVIGIGPKTPAGFISRVTHINVKGGITTLKVKPATIVQAIPAGSFNVSAGQPVISIGGAQRRALERALAASTSCTPSSHGTALIQPNVSFKIGFTATGEWAAGVPPFDNLSVVASASLLGNLDATLKGGATCSVSEPIFKAAGPRVEFSIGPLPFVLTSQFTINLVGSLEWGAGFSTTLTAGASASLGEGWSRRRGFYPISSFTPVFDGTLSGLSGSAAIELDVVPAVSATIDGAVQASLGVKAGLRLAADTAANPWWTLSVPVALTAQMGIPPLGIKSPTLNLLSKSFPLKQAGGAYGSSFNPVPGSPFATGQYPNQAVFSPTASLLATANNGDNTVSMFSVGSGGALTRVAGSPFKTGKYPWAVAFSPNGRFLAVPNLVDNTVSVFSVAGNGALTPVSGSPFATGGGPDAIAFSNDGSRLATANSNDDTVSVFSVATNGALTPVSGSPFPTGSNPDSVAFSPNGSFLATANYFGNSVSEFSVGAGGALTPVPGSPYAAGSYPSSVAFGPAGTSLLAVADEYGNTVTMFLVGPGGVLGHVTGSPFATGAKPTSVAFSRLGSELVTADSGTSQVSEFAVGSGGALSQVEGSPFGTGGPSYSVAFSPDSSLLAVASGYPGSSVAVLSG